MQFVSMRGFRIAVEVCLGLLAAVLCWADVSWAFRPGQFPVLDELSNPTLFLDGSYHQIVHFFPLWFFCDRPLGWAFVKLMDDLFRFNYTRQLECFLAIHFANTGMVFLLFRRLGVSVPISIAGVGLFGGLWTTAATATYPGAAHDMICLFFLLGSVLAILSGMRGASILSAVLFLAALRSKEFGIVTPAALTVLVALRLPRMPLRRALVSLLRRLWLHYLILLVFGLRYLSLYQGYRATITASNPYSMDPHFATVLKSLAYYTALIFGVEDSKWQLPPVALALGLGAVLCWAVVRRRAGLAFGVCAFVLTILPVALMPNQRATFYAYAPQVFLILVFCLLVDGAIGWRRNPAHLRWIAGVCIALAVFSWCLTFRRSSYFRNRINFTVTIRRICARTAHQVDAQLPPMGAETHVYVDHAADSRPWLFLVGPCSYLRLVNRQRDIFCEVDKNSDQVRAEYAADSGPKYLIDYNDDGSFAVAASRAGPPTASNR